MRREVWATVLVMLAALTMTSCVSTQLYSVPCAWCGHKVSGYYTIHDNLGSYSVTRGDFLSTDYFAAGVHPSTFNGAQQLALQDLGKKMYWIDNAPFCTLRCQNAYLASKGVTEQRIRVIPHE